jgi:hypothetical protein
MREKEFTKLQRRSNKSGGGHIYIDAFTLETALNEAGIPLDTKNLKVKRYPMKSGIKKAKIIIEITEDTRSQ